MKEIIIAFDVDGTLISNNMGMGKEKLNLEAYQLAVAFSRLKNTKLICWSGGGGDYAQQICEKYGVAHLFHSFHTKSDYDEVVWGHVDIAIDDQHEFSMADKNLIVRYK